MITTPPSSKIRLCALILGALLSALGTTWAEQLDENQVIDLTLLAEDGLNVQLVAATDLPLHVDRGARRVLDVLSAGQTLTVLGMDRFGLQVRGRGRNGSLTGWVGQKKVFADKPKALANLRTFYERQLEIEQLVAENRPAIGMSLPELKRLLGEPTTHKISATEEGQTESLVWILKKPVDLNELLAVGTDEDVLKMEVEVGRVEVELTGGLATSIQRNIEGGAGAIPTVIPPVREPFGPMPKGTVAGT
jgi:hypothetical protein